MFFPITYHLSLITHHFLMSHQAPEHSRCPVCRSEVFSGEDFCRACGSTLSDTPAQAIRSLNYLLSELSRWEEEELIGHEQASKLRESYEQRREELQEQLIARRQRASPPAPPEEATSFPTGQQRQPSPPDATKPRGPRRVRLETLADPHTIRILLYTGAAMLVVGVIIWLRDILYLKLQEPLVQAMLLALGTIAVTVSGWLTILRTRVLLTGRALTLTGSLLVPVNFWFLARSGLIEQSGSAWFVCAICALLYALTATILREKLYVYLASLATIATAWAIIYRVEREAYGLYTLTLTVISLAFLHLSRMFPAGTDDGRNVDDGRLTIDDRQTAIDSRPSLIGKRPSSLPARTSQELWGLPLAHVGLVGVVLGLLLYLPLGTGSAPSPAAGLFHLRFSEYDSSIAILLSAAVAYAAWFAGRRIFTDRRAPFYTLSVLALLWAEFLAADGLRVSGSIQLLMFTITALVIALIARGLKSEAWALALHRASLMLIIVLAIATYPVISSTDTPPLTHSLILILLVSTYAVSGSTRFDSEAAGDTLTHVVAACVSLSMVVVLAIAHFRVGEPLLLAPSLALGTTGLLLFGASFLLKTRERVRPFRAGLFALIMAFVLAALHAGFDPASDAEVYTSPIAILLLVVAYFAARRNWNEYAHDTSLLLWVGSLLLAVPLLIHALQYRLFLDVPAPWRDLLTLCASLALIIFGVGGRLRAPVLIGALVLALELAALALTSVGWLQIPLKVYLISTGALILLIWGLLEFRHEQILLVRRRFNERRELARERFGEWK